MQKKEYEDYIDKILMAELTRETGRKLEHSQSDLQKCKWTEGESNTDTDFSKLAGEKMKQVFEEIINYNSIFNNKITIEINSPDIKISFKLSEYNTPIKRKVELKSVYSETGNNAIIPGSTIGKLDINTWVIFVLRKNNNQDFEIRYGRYYKGIKITETELFQDRTPRPKILWSNYQKIEEKPDNTILQKDKKWIKKYAEAAVHRIINDVNNSSWQDDLVTEIIKIVLDNPEILNNIITKLDIDKDILIKKINQI